MCGVRVACLSFPQFGSKEVIRAILLPRANNPLLRHLGTPLLQPVEVTVFVGWSLRSILFPSLAAMRTDWVPSSLSVGIPEKLRMAESELS